MLSLMIASLIEYLERYLPEILLIKMLTNFYTNRKDVRLPVQLQRAMAAEAEAAREARAKVIAAEGKI